MDASVAIPFTRAREVGKITVVENVVGLHVDCFVSVGIKKIILLSLLELTTTCKGMQEAAR